MGAVQILDLFRGIYFLGSSCMYAYVFLTSKESWELNKLDATFSRKTLSWSIAFDILRFLFWGSGATTLAVYHQTFAVLFSFIHHYQYTFLFTLTVLCSFCRRWPVQCLDDCIDIMQLPRRAPRTFWSVHAITGNLSWDLDLLLTTPVLTNSRGGSAVLL